jgi:lariat debranching enzyme
LSLISVVGDVHTEIFKMYSHLKAWEERTWNKLDAVIHVGDFGIYWFGDFQKLWVGKEKAPIPTYVCPGNHEDIRLIAQWAQHPEKLPNLHLLPDGEITDVCGLKVGAIWGNFSWKSWKNEERIENARRNAYGGQTPGPKTMHIRRSSVEKLKSAGTFDALITHDAPAELMPMNRMQPPDFIKQQLGLDKDEKAQGCSGFNELYETGKPTHHWFGHFHKYVNCQLSDPRVTCLHCFNYNEEQSIEYIDVVEGDIKLFTAASRLPSQCCEHDDRTFAGWLQELW